MRTPTSIALFSPSFSAGGVQRVTLNLANELVLRGYPVTLVVVSGYGPLRAGLLPGVKIQDLGAKRSILGIGRLSRYLRTAKPDVFISGQTHLNVISIVARKLAGSFSQLFVVEHNHMSSVIKDANNWIDRIRPLWAKLFYPHADRILAVSQAVADDLAKQSGIERDTIGIVDNAILDPSFLEMRHAPVEHPWFNHRELPIIVGMGRLAPQKDFKTLIRAIHKVNQVRPVHLAIFGEGEQREDLEVLASSLNLEAKVWLPGYVDNPFSFISHADLFVLSSAWEGLPSALVEAMACGTSVLSTDCPAGPREILGNDDDGRLVPVGDAEAMADRILHFLDQPQDPDALIKQAQRFVSTQAVHSYLKLFPEPS